MVKGRLLTKDERMRFMPGINHIKRYNANFLREKFVHNTCPTLGINNNSERCLNEIDTRVPNSMGSFYEATSHVSKRWFARETSPDACKPEENSKVLSNHHSVGAVKTRSMDNRESIIERGTHGSNNDDTCCEIIHSNDELENEQRNDTTLKLILSWKENNLKPSWAEVSKYGTEVKYYWNRIDSRNKREHPL